MTSLKFRLTKELYWLMIALVLSISALISVAFLVDRLEGSFEQNAHIMLAADVVVRGDQELDPYFEKIAHENGLRVAKTITFPTMVQFQNQNKLVSLKAVSELYPLRGELKLQKQDLRLLPGEIWIDSQLSSSIGVRVGDQLKMGEHTYRIANVIDHEFDRGAAFMNFNPRVMMRLDDVEKTNLLGLGSRAVYRLLLASSTSDENAMHQFTQNATAYMKNQHIRGVELETLENGQPLVRKTLDQAYRLMSLVALLTAMICAVGIALASHGYMQSQQSTIALWRCFGASQKQLLKKQLLLFLKITVIASLIGILFGWGLQEILVQSLQNVIKQDLPAPSWWPVLWGVLVCVVLILGCTGPVLWELSLTSPIYALRALPIKTTWRLLTLTLSGVLTYAALLLVISKDIQLSVLLLGGFLVISCSLWWMSLKVNSQIGRYLSTIRNISGVRFAGFRLSGGPHVVALQITTLCVAMLALLLIIVLRVSVISAWEESIPQNAPNRFVLNIQPDDREGIRNLLDNRLQEKDLDMYPMIRGRLIKINDHDVHSEDYADVTTRRLIDREFNLSFSDKLPKANRIISGSWLNQTNNPHQVSLESGIMKSLGLHLGDELVFDVAGEIHSVTITSVRKLDWNSMRVNFFAIMPPAELDEAPQSWITAFHQKSNESIDQEIIQLYPNVTVINVQESIAQVRSILTQLIQALQIVFITTLMAGFVVLSITFLGTQERRIREGAILKTMGASKNFLTRVWAVESLYIGTIAGVLSGLIAAGSGWYIANFPLQIVMQVPYWVIPMGIVLGIGISVLSSLRLRKLIEKSSPRTTLQEYLR